jgi:regulation of enolase protein 1 (concanavalin A-like superfamily)
MKAFFGMVTGSLALVILRAMRGGKKKRRKINIITRFNSKRFFWHNGEPSKWSIDKKGTSMMIRPEPKRDYWSRTFYTPLLQKHDGQIYIAETRIDEEVSVTTAFTLRPVSQFDQAGIMVYIDDNCWVKAGVEYTDGEPRLSCVVTNEVRQISPSLSASQTLHISTLLKHRGTPIGRHRYGHLI